MVQDVLPVSLDELVREDVWFAMGYRGAVPEPGIRDLAESVAARIVPAARIRYMYRILPAEKISPRQIRIDDTVFTPEGIICSYLDGMDKVCLFVGTAGREFDEAVKQLNKEGDIVADFIADAIGTVLAELAVKKVEEHFADIPNHSMSYSPGYCNWDIREQHLLFPFFPAEPCGIVLSGSSLMSPEKSVSGIIAMGEKLQRQPYHCDICKNKKCYKRRESKK